MHRAAVVPILLVSVMWNSTILAWEPNPSDEMELNVQKAILEIQQKSPKIQAFFDHSAGYAVFPTVGKVGFIVGGAFGRGVVIANDRVVGYTSLSQATIGAQIGGQKYSQFIFFMDDNAVDNFKRGNFEFGAQASAVAITESATAATSYDSGVAVFISDGGGLMAEATIGGQKFSYEPKNPD